MNTELRNTEHQRNTGTLAAHRNTDRTGGQLEYHGTVEHVKNSGTA